MTSTVASPPALRRGGSTAALRVPIRLVCLRMAAWSIVSAAAAGCVTYGWLAWQAAGIAGAAAALTQARLWGSRAVLLGCAIPICGMAVRHWRVMIDALGRWASVPTPPLDLAVLRVVVFYWLFRTAGSVEKVAWWSQLPEALRFPVEGSGWLFSLMPITAARVAVAHSLLRITSLAAMIGLYTRVTAVAAALLGVYVLGIPHQFGKVNHSHHHLIWFAAVLAVSRCADALSVDALVAAWKRARVGLTNPPRASSVYTLPIRFVWLLMGVIYFFPGVWKWGGSGLDWALSDNLQSLLYGAWWRRDRLMGADGPHPWAITHAPVYQIAALGVMLFEVGFVWALFSRRLRTLAACAGVAFHAATDYFMYIRFTSLQACYVVFVGWAGGLRRIGRRVFRQRLVFIYDHACLRCCRMLGLVRIFDYLGRVSYVHHSDAAIASLKDAIPVTRSDAASGHYHAMLNGQLWGGRQADRLLAQRVLWAWPLIVWFAHGSVRGRVAYPCKWRLSAWPVAGHRLSMWGVGVVGSVLLAVNAYYGFYRKLEAWPFACYPTFDSIAPAFRTTVTLVGIDQASRAQAIDVRRLQRRMTLPRWAQLLRRMIAIPDKDKRRRRLAALWRVVVQDDPRLSMLQTVQVEESEWSIVPVRQPEGMRWATTPLRTKVVEAWRVDHASMTAAEWLVGQ